MSVTDEQYAQAITERLEQLLAEIRSGEVTVTRHKWEAGLWAVPIDGWLHKGYDGSETLTLHLQRTR